MTDVRARLHDYQNAYRRWRRRERRGTLIVQPLPGIGDMVWHLPHIHRIAASSGDGVVSILTKPRSRANELLAGDKTVDKILWLERNPGKHDGLTGLLRLVAGLRRERFACVWILHGSSRYAWAALLAGIPERRGYGRGLQRWLLNHPAFLRNDELKAHPITKANRLLELCGLRITDRDLYLAVDQSAQRLVTRRFEDLPRPWVAFGIGSSEPFKQWGQERFAALAQVLLATLPCSLFLVGGESERDMASWIIRRVGDGRIACATDMSLDQTIALLSACRLYLGNDTGALNLAAMLGVDAIGLFGGSNPLVHCRIHAVMPESGQPRSMDAITVHMVHAAARRFLAT